MQLIDDVMLDISRFFKQIYRSYLMLINFYFSNFKFILLFYLCTFTDSCEFGSNHYFLLCGLGGILSCGITHTGITPLDLVKCRIQVDPQKYKSVFNGFRVTIIYQLIIYSLTFIGIY